MSQARFFTPTRRRLIQLLAASAPLAPVARGSGQLNLRSATAEEGPNLAVTIPNGSITGPYQEKNFTYIVQSKNQAYPNSLRILLPDRMEAMTRPRVVYVLPVNPDTRVQWNDGLITFRNLNLHNRYNVIAVAPSFSDWPWYADHPTKTNLWQESYFIQDVVPFVDNLMTTLPMFENVGFTPEAKTTRLLLGFSKSGNGSFQLLLRYLDTFQAASIWDAPIMKTAPDQFEMPTIYGTQANFDNYSIPKLLASKAGVLSAQTARMALYGYSLFGGPNPLVDPTVNAPVDHLQKAHDYMTTLKIPHIYESSTSREHRWDSGWMDQAMAALDAMSR